MGERLLCKQEVIGSIPFTSTRRQGPALLPEWRDGWPVAPDAPVSVFDNRAFPSAWANFREVALGRTSQGGMDGQVNKGVRWMPWHQAAKKDVAGCDKPRGVASER